MPSITNTQARLINGPPIPGHKPPQWLPGKNPLKDVHAALDSAVLDAYGFAPKGDLLAQLLELNLAVATQIEKDEAVTSPGLPPVYPNPSQLVTDDCIRPS